MHPPTTLKRTPLYHVQHAHGGRFVPFAGWEMPVQFAGVMLEHTAVRQRAGLFDVSHMGEIVVAGPQALAALQAICTNDLATLVAGRALYTVMCTPDGGIIDDLIVYCEQPRSRYFLCVNASRRDDDLAHIVLHAKPFDCTVEDVSDTYAQLALQGPAALSILAAVCPAAVASLPAFAWADTSIAGLAAGDMVRVARTGYTGEHGYELYCSNTAAEPLWQALEAAGQAHGLVPCGLGARDTLRLEMKYPLYGNDIDLAHNPLEAGLGWVVKFNKGDFCGRDALLATKQQGCTRRWVGLKMTERGIARPGYPIVAAGKEVGMVTSGTHSPTLGEPIACGYVPQDLAAVGTPVSILIRDKPVAAVVAKTPFYRGAS